MSSPGRPKSEYRSAQHEGSPVNRAVRAPRRLIAWFAIAVAMLLPLGGQLHALSHALRAVQEAGHTEPLAPQSQACEQCLLYVALDAALPSHAVFVPLVTLVAHEQSMPVAARRAVSFSAYDARGPPIHG